MSDNFFASKCHPVLATDLDGTLIPLDGDEQNLSDLRTLAREIQANQVTLVFVTGRHFASVSRAIEEFQLPAPDWIICDVGTSIFERVAGHFRSIGAYEDHLQQIISAMPIDQLGERLAPIKGLQLQEQEKQGRFKLSFYADASALDRLHDEVQTAIQRMNAPYGIIHSQDPFTGTGLIDLLPAEASKAHALSWWCRHTGLRPDDLVFAGDSGNDLAALTAGHRAILVANADHRLVQHVDQRHQEAGWKNRLYITRGRATSGVLEGCRWFELLGHHPPTISRLGATPVTHTRTHFRVWAPDRKEVSVEVFHGESTRTRHTLVRDGNGFFCGDVSGASPRAHYFYVLDGEISRPDPASRYQPTGVHGASEIIDPHAFPWTDAEWPGVAKRDLIIYELHVGAFTQEGTLRAAIQRLPELTGLGVTAVEVMPVAQSPGRWNWGYDGVNLFAVRNTYGEPDDFRAFVDACHGHGLAVILDVVYNHVGPEGNYLADFGPYFSTEHNTPWGDAFNFAGRHADRVREFVIENAIRWLDEFHLDGLRLDAVHFMHDERTPHILQEIRAAVSAYAETTTRAIHLIAETNVYDPDLLASPAYDAMWCDCLMHSIYTHALPDLQLSHREYRGASDLAEVLQHGFLYCFTDGQPVRVAADRRRKLAREAGPALIESLVTALQTHDGVGNHPHGKRLHHLTSKAFQRAAAAITMLYPSIPLIFMGEEYATEALFPFFVDFHDPQLREAVDTGRAREYPQHIWSGATSPSDPRAFWSAKCHRTGDQDQAMRAWYRDLIQLRKQGLAEGWLCASRLTVSHHFDLDVFCLRYAIQGGASISILARLARAEHTATVTASPAASDVFLSSEPVTCAEDGRIQLGPHQAVVARWLDG